MQLFGRLVNFATMRGAMALTALAIVAAPAAAQTRIVLSPEAAVKRAGKWVVTSDSSAIYGGRALRHPDAGAPKQTTALASPANYFEMTFNATAGVGYRLGLRGKADKGYWGNDSVFVQFSGSVSSSGSARWRIGTTAATEINLEECDGCGLSNTYSWQDNGWGRDVKGPLVYFATTGPQRVRVQTREDGLSVDVMTLNPETTAVSQTATSTSGTLLKVMTWNTHHGIGTDGRYSLSRFVSWIARSGANVVVLNEVERYIGSYGNEDQPARYAALLRSATGKTWYYNFAHRSGGSTGQGNVVLSTFRLEDSDDQQLSYERSVARIQIVVNGIRVNVFGTHLDAESSTRRATQMNQLKSYASSFSQQWIYGGDFNAWPGAAEIKNMTYSNYDAWAVAVANNTDIAYAGNLAGNTRNSRIDYVFFSKYARRLHLKSTRVFDTRDSNGVMPSDHRPVMATFEVK
ncbi:MAG: endonuclease/exonuclease/phosphatase family protein [Vicinamibacterales bacterium]